MRAPTTFTCPVCASGLSMGLAWSSSASALVTLPPDTMQHLQRHAAPTVDNDHAE